MKIYDFSDPIEYVNREFALKKEQNPRFSLRSYARVLGYENPSLLSSVLKGERRLSPDLATKISSQLNLTPSEQKYFQLLLLIKYAKNENERLMYTEMLEQTRPDEIKSQFSMGLDSFRFIDDWYHLAILEMIGLSDFKYDYGYIAQRLGRGINRELVEAAIKRLIRLGLVEESKTKRFLKRKEGSLILDKNIPNDSIKKHHAQFMDFAKMAIFEQDITDRDIRSSTLALKKKDFKKAQEILREAHAKILELCASGDGEEVYTLSTQFFSLTQTQRSSSEGKLIQ